MTETEEKCCQDHPGYEIEYVCAKCGHEMCMLCKWHHGKVKGEYLCSICGNTKTGVDASFLKKIKLFIIIGAVLLGIIYYVFIMPYFVEEQVKTYDEMMKNRRNIEDRQNYQRRIQDLSRPDYNP